MKKKLFLFFEVVFWLGLVIGLMFFLVSLFHPDLDIKKYYEVHFKDADGVIVGTPVRFMGLDIGHVNDIEILKDRVKLNLAITQEDCKLPKTCLIRIEASSLGGSRSLELFPSAEIFQSSKIAAIEPQRINEVLLSSNDFIKAMTDGMANMAKIINDTINSKEYANIDNINADIKKMDKRLQNLSIVLENKKLETEENLNLTKLSLQKQYDIINNFDIDKTSIMNFLNQTEADLKDISDKISKYDAKKTKTNIREFLKKTDKIEIKNKEEVVKDLQEMISSMKKMQEMLASFDGSLSSENIEKAMAKIKGLRENSKNINNYLREEK